MSGEVLGPDMLLAPLHRALKDSGYAGWICNELDAWPDPAAGARESRAYVEAEMAKA